VLVVENLPNGKDYHNVAYTRPGTVQFDDFGRGLYRRPEPDMPVFVFAAKSFFSEMAVDATYTQVYGCTFEKFLHLRQGVTIPSVRSTTIGGRYERRPSFSATDERGGE
jgi:hypothetical protein